MVYYLWSPRLSWLAGIACALGFWDSVSSLIITLHDVFHTPVVLIFSYPRSVPLLSFLFFLARASLFVFSTIPCVLSSSPCVSFLLHFRRLPAVYQ